GIEFIWLGLYFADGYFETGNPNSPPEILYTYRELFEMMNKTQNLVIDDVRVDFHDEYEDLEIIVGCPIIVNDEITRYLVGSYKYDVLSDVIGSINISSGSTAYIINDNGKFMAHRDTDKVRFGETIFTDNSGVFGVENILEKMNRRQIESVVLGSGSARKIISFAPVRGTYWCFAIETPLEDFMPAIRRGIVTSILLTVLLLVVFAVIANLFIARLVTTPLKIITSHAECQCH
ncbi:MAG: cache domain-containing protein, partial [Methanomassiliicoccaceae archaeon]|nr:cache domain-containing protein [Methanomassiliicoccaceae archaeon]